MRRSGARPQENNPLRTFSQRAKNTLLYGTVQVWSKCFWSCSKLLNDYPPGWYKQEHQRRLESACMESA